MPKEPSEITVEDNLSALEHMILLILGESKGKISMLHLHKETFLLWNFSSHVREFISFIAHYRGPYSNDITSIIKNPSYLSDCWNYIPPLKHDSLTGGYVEVTFEGKKTYDDLYQQLTELEDIQPLLSGIKIVHEVYDNLEPEELLLLIYDTFPEYTENSDVYSKIYDKRKKIASNLLSKEKITPERYMELVGEGYF
jgi:hypothetical protein